MENIFNKAISERIMKLIKEKEVSFYRIFIDCKIPRASFYKCMENKSEWKPIYLSKLAEYFKVSLDYLINGNTTRLEKENERLKEEKQALLNQTTQLYKVAEKMDEKYGVRKKKHEQ